MTLSTEIKKQFIAGAKCPSCGEQDSLLFYRQDNDPIRECVECDFKESFVETELRETKEKEQKSALSIKFKEL